MTSLELAAVAARAMDSKKAKDIRVLKVEDLTVLTDYFVICTGSSATQVKALADEVEYQLGQAGVKPLRREGMDARNWILLDYGTVIVHVFYPETRDFYDLEHLWADATPVEIEF
ncbi:ribosome silencing factor [Anaerofilum sp. BX8]|uniref:Ribosomal silencing factor RsfS n=1 Tax=Anaerofilum hominis TaxID=2763016 RepID=A0A923I8S9_9FIRM|nr:ribosome silencing factor [Anaerofilum hominis]MBC5580363.1 ribosome silencing factor [Anaerofilum hominis]